ncbi:hypothetical protein ATE84_0891 [Aquimarina sp. MAR_2010_214]|uniref:hypothetical protein n=1 Tax=Aquimarina sp. MAR_2010_214 TaxID=1250026 RepID=UPI000C70F836|nr:hypothetical protein [Aquimarina sp. MAR_2010_214]PKV48876.1 hypothetical protein ATE84_0891 [Aquimarina sp. MAR_2010_214]
MKIGKIGLVIVLGLIFLTSCNSDDDEPEFESTALISGFDMTLCTCCGGWIIDIDGEESENRFSELPQNSGINLETVEFPISVKLNWTKSNEYCGQGITIESLKLIE